MNQVTNVEQLSNLTNQLVLRLFDRMGNETYINVRLGGTVHDNIVPIEIGQVERIMEFHYPGYTVDRLRSPALDVDETDRIFNNSYLKLGDLLFRRYILDDHRVTSNVPLYTLFIKRQGGKRMSRKRRKRRSSKKI